jgi:hypothetical protein
MLIGRSPNILTKASTSTMTEVFYLRTYQEKRYDEETRGPYGRLWI